MKKAKDIINSVVFIIIIFFLALIFVIKDDSEISYSERRKLAQCPKFTLSSVLSGEFSTDLEDYMTDQFAFRDTFRLVNYYFRHDIMNQSDVNGLYVYDNVVYKSIYPLDKKQIGMARVKISEVQSEYLSEDNNVYVSVIPDKAYYSGNENSLNISHDELVECLLSGLSGVTYIDIKDTLNKDSYYITDIHWRQEKLFECADKLITAMTGDVKAKSQFETKEYDSFVGGYSAQIGTCETEVLKYLVFDTFENVKVYDMSENKELSVYNEDALGALDSYDIFLYGAKPLIKIVNHNSQDNQRLIIFRDSFASSITPLLIDSYSEIILVDLRYIQTSLLSEYVNFDNCDVLFLYSDSVVNGASVSK